MTYTLSNEDLARCRAINMRYNDRIKQIALAVSAETAIPMSAIYGPRRRQDIVHARWLVMYLAYCEGMSYQVIGAAMNRDHTSVIHGVKQEQKRREKGEPPAE